MLVEVGKEWPPKADRARLDRYERYRKLFSGEDAKGYTFLGCLIGKKQRREISLIMNYPAIITKGAVDILCGEAPQFVVTGKKSPKKLQEALNEILKENLFNSVLYASMTVCSYRGDAVFRLRDNGKRVVVEQIPAHHYFVRLDPDNDLEALGQCVAWVRPLDNSQGILRVEHHEPGLIINEAYLVKRNQLERKWKIVEQVSLASVYGEEAPDEVQETGIDKPLLWHVPNFYDGENYFGPSDYGGGLETLFEAANNRLSKIDQYLDRHQRPILVGFRGMADQTGAVEARKDYVEGDAEKAKDLPRYVTWDGQMASAFEQLQELKRQIRVQSETPKRLTGESEDSSIDSGRAMLNDFIPITKKVNRKRTMVDPKVKDLLLTALQLHALRHEGPSPEGFAIDIKWQDGVPQDYMEIVQTEAVRIQNGLSSVEGSLKRIDVCSPEEAQAEIARMAAESAEKAKLAPQTGQQTQDSPGDNAPAQAGEGGMNATGQAGNGAVGARERQPGR